MTIDDVKKVCVVGGGLMGKQIALNTAVYGYDVWLYDSFPGVLPKVEDWKEGYLAGRIAKGKMTEEQVAKIKANFHLTDKLEEAATGAQLVIEAIVEVEDAKSELFRQLDKLVAEDTIIATNSSFMPSSMFADQISHPERLANLHYFNPALVMKLTEVVKGEHTADITGEILAEFSRRTNKKPVILNKEIEGFIVNRISRAVTEKALELVELGVASYEDVDIAIENGLNYPMGPFRLMDLTGIDLAYTVLKDAKEKGLPCIGYDLVKAKYDAGEYGQKTGKGWYEYSKK